MVPCQGLYAKQTLIASMAFRAEVAAPRSGVSQFELGASFCSQGLRIELTRLDCVHSKQPLET
jgi:hypothetical protein